MIIPFLVGFQIVGAYTVYELLRIKYHNLEKRVASLEEERHPARPNLNKIPYVQPNKDIHNDLHRPEYRELM